MAKTTKILYFLFIFSLVTPGYLGTYYPMPWGYDGFNRTEWASQHSFHPGDEIGFYWPMAGPSETNTVLYLADEIGYERCDISRATVIGSVNHSLHMVFFDFTLTDTGEYYFISPGFDNCWDGARMKVSVKPPTPPPVKPPAPQPVKPPTPPPVKPPTYPPVKPPAPPPVRPQTPPPVKKEAAVGGVVYCKSCKYKGVDTLVGASPLEGAVVKLVCKKKNLKSELAKTDKNGYFYFRPKWLTSNGIRQCNISLFSSPSKKCNITTNLHGGVDGGSFRHVKSKLPFQLFAVGPFAFDTPKKCY